MTLQDRRTEVQIVDVRCPNEWEAGRIDGAVHIPQDELEDRRRELDPARPVVTVCRNGTRSAAVAEQLRADGFQADTLEGGLAAWVEGGLDLTTPDGARGAVVAPDPSWDDRPAEHQRLQAELLSVIFDFQERFGDREVGEGEIRVFLRERLIGEGRSAEEAEAILARMDETG